MVLQVSLIIPTLNRAEVLRRTLRSIVAVVHPSDSVEIIVVDNASVDRTAEVCREVRMRFPQYEWRYFYEPVPGLLSGRHRGAKEAQGEILSFLDDDVLLSPPWLDGLTDAFSDPGVVLVGGPSRPQFEIEPPDWLEGLWVEADGCRMLTALSLISYDPAVRIIEPFYIFGLNFSIRKAAFKACGGFHPDCIQTELQRYQGDGETGLAFKVKAAGLQALYHPGVAVAHVIPASRLSLERFERRGFYQGICDSYTQIRREGAVSPALTRSLKEVLRSLIRKPRRDYLLRRGDTEAVRQLMEVAHTAGFAFHQNEVRNDAGLLQWVTRSDYFDYALPEGWNSYIEGARAINSVSTKSH